jgi:hypothetical protein
MMSLGSVFANSKARSQSSQYVVGGEILPFNLPALLVSQSFLLIAGSIAAVIVAVAILRSRMPFSIIVQK